MRNRESFRNGIRTSPKRSDPRSVRQRADGRCDECRRRRNGWTAKSRRIGENSIVSNPLLSGLETRRPSPTLLGVRLLTLEIHEPLPGLVLPEMATICGPDEAARRYRAIAATTLRQLRGLAETRIRLSVAPTDADEAVRFWLLPRLAGRWSADDSVFRSDGWEIDFGGTDSFVTAARGEILCPFLGARWVHTALIGHGRTIGEITGPATCGGRYFHAPAADPALPPRILPELEILRTDSQWHQALESPLGPALKRAWEEEV
jgi:hypothetical protein